MLYTFLYTSFAVLITINLAQMNLQFQINASLPFDRATGERRPFINAPFLPRSFVDTFKRAEINERSIGRKKRSKGTDSLFMHTSFHVAELDWWLGELEHYFVLFLFSSYIYFVFLSVL